MPECAAENPNYGRVARAPFASYEPKPPMGRNMTDDILDAWIPVIRIERVPKDLRLPVLRKLLAKLERADPHRPRRPKRGRSRKDALNAAATDSEDG
jgi:hypothetical protein